MVSSCLTYQHAELSVVALYFIQGGNDLRGVNQVLFCSNEKPCEFSKKKKKNLKNVIEKYEMSQMSSSSMVFKLVCASESYP